MNSVPDQPSIVTLIGYRATGKSTVAPKLAHRLGWAFADSDVEVEVNSGRTIAQIFSDDGEAEFRRIEREVISGLLKQHKLVLSSGGGAILDVDTRGDIASAGPVVWLQASVETILKRLTADAETTKQQRPGLTDHADQRVEIAEVLNLRTKLYAGAATIVINTDELDGDSVIEAVYKEVTQALGYGDDS